MDHPLSGGSNVMYAPLDSYSCPKNRLSLDDADAEAIYNHEKALEALIPIPAEDRRAGGVGRGPGDWTCTRSRPRRRASSDGARRTLGPRARVQSRL